MANDSQQVKLIKNNLSSGEYQVHLSDFALFLSVMRHKRAYECVLSMILNEPGLELKEVKVEQVILNKDGKRAIRLDAWAESMDNRQFDAEMQNDSSSDSIPKRIRYYQGLLDTPVLKAGKQTKYRELPSTVIIFITQEDIFHKDLAKYTFMEQCEEVQGLHLEDGTTKIFLNMASKNGSKELVSLLQYMKNTTLDNPDITVRDERLVELDRIVTEVKENEEWEAMQMNLIEIGIEKGKAEGKAEGVAEEVIDFLEDYGIVPDKVQEMIFAEKDLATLKKWVKLAARAGSLEGFLAQI